MAEFSLLASWVGLLPFFRPWLSSRYGAPVAVVVNTGLTRVRGIGRRTLVSISGSLVLIVPVVWPRAEIVCCHVLDIRPLFPTALGIPPAPSAGNPLLPGRRPLWAFLTLNGLTC